MYKIYVNENLLTLCTPDTVKQGKHKDGVLHSPYSGKTKMLLNYIDMLEKTNRYDSISIYHSDIKKLWQDFKSLFRIIDAGGGIVENEQGQVLFIHRRGFWDLPKGKIEVDETKREAAIREVEEETGVEDLSIIEKIGKTYHTYKLKSGVRAIKRSHWYHMRTHKQSLLPQVEEDIEIAKWMKPQKLIKSGEEMYSNIQLILEQYQKVKNKRKSIEV